MQSIWTLFRRNPEKKDAGNNLVRIGSVFELFEKTRKWFDIINRVELSIFSNSQPIERTRNNPFANIVIKSPNPPNPLSLKDIKKNHINVLA